LLLTGASPSHAQTSLPRARGPIVLDGAPDEDAWRSIPPYPVIVYEPAWGSPLEQHTLIRVAYDDDYLYLGAELYDDRPDDVRAGSLYRDRYSGDDTVGIVIDSFNDNRNALLFYTTPAGMRSDATVVDDMASGESDTSWNGYWEAQARRTPYGWSAEMRIPFFTLGFQSRAHHVAMGLGVYRWMARTGSRYVWPPVRPHWARGYAKPSRLADVSLEGVRSRRAIYMTPYALAGVRIDHPDGAASTTTRVVEAGADLRTNLLPNLTLDLTVNTDFAQVEADDARINLTRFPLFFPEKRQFFLDRADIFAFSWERDSRLFNSRRIGLRHGQLLRIYGGTRLAGRAGDWDLGLLDMKTAAPDGAGFGENLSVLRLRQRLPQSGSSFGAMLTSRLTEGQGHNVIAGADADVAVVGDEFLTLKAAWSASSGVPPEASSPVERAASRTGPRGLVRWQRRSALGLSYDVELAGLGSGYRSDLGFEERADVSFAAGRASYLWLQGKGAFFSQLWAEARAHGYRRNADGRIDSSLVEASFNAETPEGHYVSLLASRTTEDVAEPFDVASSSVTPGEYAMEQASVTASGADSLRWRPSLTVTLGDFYGGRLLGATGALIINPNAHFELGLDAEINDIHLPDAQHQVTSLARARLQLALDTHASLMTLAQYNQADGTLSVSARARYNLREGSDAWLVYDERQTEERGLGSAPGGQSRALLLKLNHTFLP
jgi:Domain of unknown function (DUF5916)/Carbohydrate family 9 binding domain-like